MSNTSKVQNVKRSKAKHPLRTLVFLTHPTAILIVILFVLAYWRVPTWVQIELVVDQEAFAVETTDTKAILHSLNKQTIVVKEGKISYPEYPEINAVVFTFPERIVVEVLEKFRIEKFVRDSEHKEIRIRLNGVAKRISTGLPGSLQDHRLSHFDALKKSRWVVWLGILGWLTATIIGWYRVYKELEG